MYLLLIVRLLMPGFALAQALGAPGAYIAAALLYLLCSAGYATVFAKAGQPVAKAFVPVLNVYTAFEVSGAGILLFAGYAVSLVAGIVLAQAEQISTALTVFFYAYFCFRMAAAFGKDLPFAAALLLAEPIAAFVLGISAGYRGPAKALHPFQPFNVKTVFGEDSIFDDEMNLKDEYRDEIDR